MDTPQPKLSEQAKKVEAILGPVGCLGPAELVAKALALESRLAVAEAEKARMEQRATAAESALAGLDLFFDFSEPIVPGDYGVQNPDGVNAAFAYARSVKLAADAKPPEFLYGRVPRSARAEVEAKSCPCGDQKADAPCPTVAGTCGKDRPEVESEPPIKYHLKRSLQPPVLADPEPTPPAAPEPAGLTDDQVKHMVDRFLGWRLPENFSPDAGISFKATFNEGTEHPMKHEPVGTNLFNASQAEAMVRHMAAGMPPDAKPDSLSAHKARRNALLAEAFAAPGKDDEPTPPAQGALEEAYRHADEQYEDCHDARMNADKAEWDKQRQLLRRAAAEHAEVVAAFHDASRLRSEIQRCRIQAEKERDALRAELEKVKAEIGTPPPGSHPDEAKPRDVSWHAERANWTAEVEHLRKSLSAALSRAEQAEKERDELKDSRSEAAHALNVWAWRGRVGEAVATLLPFVTHSDGCAAVRVIGRFGSRSGLRWVPGDDAKCDCGIKKALAATECDPGGNPLQARVRELEAQIDAKAECFGLECAGCEGLLDHADLLYCESCSLTDTVALGKLLEAIDGNLGNLFANGDDVSSERLVELALAKLAARPTETLTPNLGPAKVRP